MAPLRWVGSQGIGLDPRKGLEQMEAREMRTGEERTARRSGGREVEETEREHSHPTLSWRDRERQVRNGRGVKREAVD